MNEVVTIALAVAGWLATTWLAYRWGLHSQKLQRDEAAKNAIRSRRVEFVGYLKGWRIEFDRLHMERHGYRRSPGALVDEFPSFVQHAERIRTDLPEEKKVEFERLVADITKCGPRDFDAGERYQQLLSLFDRLTAYVEKA